MRSSLSFFLAASMIAIASVMAVACAQPAQPTTTTTTPVASTAATIASSSPASGTTTAVTTSEPAKKKAVVGEVLGSPLTNAVTTSSDKVADADSVILGVRPQLKRCYETHNGAGPPPIAGMVSCGLRITKEGKVASISVTRRDRLPDPLMYCIVKELMTAKFAARDDEQIIQVPVRFAVPGDE